MGGFNYDLDRMREAVSGPTVYKPKGVSTREFLSKHLQQYQHETAKRFDPARCLVCGEHHNHGNLPCPTMQVIA